MEYPNLSKVEGQPSFEKSPIDILNSVKVGGAIKVLDPLDYITSRQRRWYKGVCLPSLVKADENGETAAWWDLHVKSECNGLKYLKKEIFFTETIDGHRFGIGRLTTKGVGKRNMTLFIEEILSQAMIKGWDVSPPDADLRK